MEIKTLPAMTVLYSTHQTTIPQLIEFVGTAVKALYQEITRNNWLVSGPQYWIYHGMDGQPDTVFTLEIAVPVQGQHLVSETLGIKELAPFNALVAQHEGAWDQMPVTYGKIIQEITQRGLQPATTTREVYLNVDFNTPDNNRTEIQFGIN